MSLEKGVLIIIRYIDPYFKNEFKFHIAKKRTNTYKLHKIPIDS